MFKDISSYDVLIIFPSQQVLDTCLMYKKPDLFVYKFAITVRFLNSVRVYPVKVNIDMFYHKNNTFRNTVF